MKSWFRHPLTHGHSVDDPAIIARHRAIIRSKPFLRRIYFEWYELIRDSLPAVPGAVLELGSGAGFLREVLPNAFTSDVFAGPGIQLVADGRQLPIGEGQLRALVLVDVLHHIPECRRFFAEAARCVREGGAIVAIEPWVTTWSKPIYSWMHHEPFEPRTQNWEFPATGPLSGANQALPWILFQRDRAIFERTFPQWRIVHLNPFMPWRYLVSGGVGWRSFAPGWAYPVVAALERLVTPWMGSLAMFVHVVLQRTPAASGQQMTA